MASLLEYKCPCCGGKIEFDSSIQKPKCPYCDTEFNIADLSAYDDELKSDKADEMNWQSPDEQWAEAEADTDGMKIYVCESCGGEVVVDETAAALKCPWCDSPIVIKGSVAGSLRPKYVIPFKLDKEAAKTAFKKHLKGKRLLPKVFKDENHIDGIRGIYVPFWLFDAHAYASFRFRGTKSRSWRSGDYHYTETQHYALIRTGELDFDNIPVDASKKMADDLMDSLEPFDYSEMVDFQTAYLSGFLADKYDVSVDESQPRANLRIRNTSTEKIRSTVHGYGSVRIETGNVNVSNGQVDYVLLPVWIMNTSWNGNKYIFAMNGQTGKFIGNLPIDKGSAWKMFFQLLLLLSIGIFISLLGFYAFLYLT